MTVRLQLKIVTQQLAADETNVPLRITSAEVLGAVGSTNRNAAEMVFEQQGKLMLLDLCCKSMHVQYTTMLETSCPNLAPENLHC